MNNKGFTLIELIATIALLAIVALISFVSITNVLEDRKNADCNTLVNNIKMATKEYVSDNRYNGISEKITAKELIDEKYLKGNIINPYTKEEMDSKSISISIELNADYTVKNITVGGISCNS